MAPALGRLAVVLLATVSLSAPAAALGAPASAAGPLAGPVARRADPPHLHQWWYDRMRLAQAHRISTGRGATVAVIDSDLNSHIPELRDADISFGHTCSAGYEQRAKPLTGPVADHGTAMTAAIVGSGRGTAPGGLGILGVAPDAHVLFFPNDADGKLDKDSETVDCDELEIGKQVVDAARRGADVISLSFTCGSTLAPYLRKAMAMGAVVVAAAGDRRDPSTPHGQLQFPASMPGVVAVEAVDDHAKPWTYNPSPIMNGGKYHALAPTIAAPGVAVENVGYATDTGEWTSVGTRTGTSDATAIISGVLALVKARYPRATNNQLIQQLIHNSGGSRRFGWDQYYGYGIVSANRMLATDPTGWPDRNPLLDGPPAALKDFPSSVYGAARASASPSPTATAASPSATSTPSSVAASNGGGGSGGSGSAGGLPAWTWVAAAGVLVAAAGGLAVRTGIGRRARPPGQPQN